MSELEKKTKKSMIWSLVEGFFAQGLQFAMGLVIARVLVPEDYGLFAMLAIFIALSQTFVDGGFYNALIQKQDRTSIDFSTAFYFNLFCGICFYLILYLLAPYVAQFYQEPSLEFILQILALNLIISSFIIVPKAKIAIALNFKRQALISLTAVIVSSAVALWMAIVGYGVWSLVVQMLLQTSIIAVLMWGMSKWLPSLEFSFESFKRLFGFGNKLLISNVIHTVYANMYMFFIGKYFSSAELGYYNRATVLANFPSTNIVDVIYRVMFPILCELQSDKEKLREAFLNYLSMTCYVVFPCMIGFIVLAEPIVELLLTQKWLGIVPILQILCVGCMLWPVMRINNHFLYVVGRTDVTLKAELIKKAVAIVILLIAIQFSLEVVAWSFVLYCIVDVCIITFFTREIVNISLKQEIEKLSKALLVSCAMGLIVYFSQFVLMQSLLIIQVLIQIILGILVYIMMSKIFNVAEFNLLLSVLKKSKVIK